MENILRETSNKFDLADFEIYKQSSAFDIYLYKKDHKIELAILREQSKPHYHTQETGHFLFLDSGILQLGGCRNEVGFVSNYNVNAGSIHIIAPYVLHSAGPLTGGKEIRLLIGNEKTLRGRNNNEYPDDTFFPETIKILE